MLYVETKDYKSGLLADRKPAKITGPFSVDYNMVGGQYFGSKVLLFVHNCPSRYWARKAVNYWLTGKVRHYGYSRAYFGCRSRSTMPKTSIIAFKGLAFAIGYKGGE